jgi:hypothetical protein
MIERKGLKPIIQTKDGVLDPPRFPLCIVPIENEAKKVFIDQNKKMILSLAESMAKYIKQ